RENSGLQFELKALASNTRFHAYIIAAIKARIQVATRFNTGDRATIKPTWETDRTDMPEEKMNMGRILWDC
ncbi:unnamed protein product, partial [Sphenostylis stenocarpa]